MEASRRGRTGAREPVTELSPLAWRLRRCLLSLERDRIQLAEIWACLIGNAPHVLAAEDRRHTLRRLLDELEHANWLALPHDPLAYDHRDPPLPRSVEVLAASERARRLGATRAVSWDPRMAWAADVDVSAEVLEDLVRINRWLVDEAPAAVIVPPRERSLELFGAGREERLETLSRTRLFREDRLRWDLLCCVPVPPPFVWSPVGDGTVLLVVSGHETFASVRRVLVEAPSTTIGVVAHGAGAHIATAVTFARMLDRMVNRILYYGDLGLDDLDAAVRADVRARDTGLPAVEPAASLYSLLMTHGTPSPAPPVEIGRATQLAAWLPPDIRDEAAKMLVGGRRLAQEWVGYALLVHERIWQRLGVP